MKAFLNLLYRLFVKGRNPIDLDLNVGKYRLSVLFTKQTLTRPIFGGNVMLDVSHDTGPALILEIHIGVFSFLIDFYTYTPPAETTSN